MPIALPNDIIVLELTNEDHAFIEKLIPDCPGLNDNNILSLSFSQFALLIERTQFGCDANINRKVMKAAMSRLRDAGRRATPGTFCFEATYLGIIKCRRVITVPNQPLSDFYDDVAIALQFADRPGENRNYYFDIDDHIFRDTGWPMGFPVRPTCRIDSRTLLLSEVFDEQDTTLSFLCKTTTPMETCLTQTVIITYQGRRAPEIPRCCVDGSGTPRWSHRFRDKLVQYIVDRTALEHDSEVLMNMFRASPDDPFNVEDTTRDMQTARSVNSKEKNRRRA